MWPVSERLLSSLSALGALPLEDSADLQKGQVVFWCGESLGLCLVHMWHLHHSALSGRSLPLGTACWLGLVKLLDCFPSRICLYELGELRRCVSPAEGVSLSTAPKPFRLGHGMCNVRRALRMSFLFRDGGRHGQLLQVLPSFPF